MSYPVIISRQNHSNSAFELVLYAIKKIGKLKKWSMFNGFNAIIWFWMLKYEVWVNFSDDKIKT